MLTLYEFGLSGNCHKVRLLLSLLGLQYQSTLLNNAEREHKTEQFLQLNPFGQVPVITDGDTLVRDSQAILVYLARTYGADEWFPHDPAKMAEVVSWLAVAANEVARGPMRCACTINLAAQLMLKKPRKLLFTFYRY